jgi:hypothetical protein
MSEIETFCAGPSLEYAVKAVSELSSRQRRSHNSLAQPVQEEYSVSIDAETANVVERLYNSVDATELVRAIKHIGLDEVDEYEPFVAGFDIDDDEQVDLGTVMQKLDTKIAYGHASRDTAVEKVSKKRQREAIYIPELINMVGDGGDIYMAKSLSSVAKVRMAWDLHDENEVVVVDSYKWGDLLGWKQLKTLPHGKNKIREQLGDKLSDDVLDKVAGSSVQDTETKADTDSSSRGRRTRTKPTDEILNVATSSRHRDRFKRESEDIKESFEDNDGIGHLNDIGMLVLFPTTTDLNMTDHWWVAGDRWDDDAVAIANCNKGTFEYLNDCEQVWHIEDYIEQAEDYEFDTNHGPVTMGTIARDTLVVHTVPEETKDRFLQSNVIEDIPQILPEYVDSNMYSPPDLPHPDDMLYAPVTPEDVFWLRPELESFDGGENGVIFYASSSPRDVGYCKNLSSDYKLYARARLSDWDFDATELSTLDGASYSIDLDDGGYELVETLAKLHDAGQQPFSETPESRWSNV